MKKIKLCCFTVNTTHAYIIANNFIDNELENVKVVYINEKSEKRKLKGIISKFYKKINDISSIFKYFKIIVSRSGASTITEIILTNSASILLPSYNVTANHQYKNAFYLKEKNACILMENYQKDSYLEVYDLYINNVLVEKIKDNLKSIKINNSIDNVIRLIK